MKRILLFLATNIAVIALASLTLNILGVGSYLTARGLNMGNLFMFCLVFGFAGSFVSLFLSKWMAKMGTGTQIIEQPRTSQERWLLETISELSGKAGIRMPEVGIFPSSESNAFATGWNRNDALVAVSQGLLDRFSPAEAKAVIGHEIGHVANGDMVTLSLLQGVVNTFVMFLARVIGYAVDSFMRRDDDSEGVGMGFYIVSFVAEIILGFLASAIVMWFSRYREFHADAAGANLAGTQNMIAALERLRSEYDAPSAMPASMTAFAIRNNSTGAAIAALFSSHPPLDKRIDALRQSL
ncbi:Protease HtpX [invertebrate metagenome]|uniref:Protease HtpX n=1 Tax=invertebrate metagenome TaxID=1711999 RepID=A0A2H9T387_9ZZZZ